MFFLFIIYFNIFILLSIHTSHNTAKHHILSTITHNHIKKQIRLLSGLEALFQAAFLPNDGFGFDLIAFDS